MSDSATKPAEPAEPDDTYRDTLSSLSAAYLLDRAVMDEYFQPIPVIDRCRYCQGPWRHWKLSRFEGHTRCVVTMPFQQRLVRFIDQNPGMTYWMVGTALGVSPAVVNAWWANVKNPRSGPRAQAPTKAASDA